MTGLASLRLDGEFFFAVQDAVAGVLDDDGDELAGVVGAKLHGLLVYHDPAVGVDAAAGGDRTGGQRGGGGVDATCSLFRLCDRT